MKITADGYTTEIEAPWGHVKLDLNDNLGFIEHFIRQLEYFLNTGVSPNPEATRQDIEGYKILLATGSQTIAHRFLTRKNAYARRGEIVRNLDVIAAMKASGEWE